jgi:hypothetical protein
MEIALGMPLEHRVFLYDACSKYWSYKKFRRPCRRRSFVARAADKMAVYMKRFRGVGSNVDRKTTCSRRVLTDEILEIVDSAFSANKQTNKQTNVSVPSARTAATLLHLHTKKGSGGSCNSLCSLKQDWILETGSFLWSLKRVQTPHSFCSASWVLDLPVLQVPIWNTTYLIVLVWLCEMVFVFRNDYWATFFFPSETSLPPHVVHIVTSFLHTSPIRGENCFFTASLCNPSRRFWIYSLFKLEELSI